MSEEENSTTCSVPRIMINQLSSEGQIDQHLVGDLDSQRARSVSFSGPTSDQFVLLPSSRDFLLPVDHSLGQPFRLCRIRVAPTTDCIDGGSTVQQTSTVSCPPSIERSRKTFPTIQQDEDRNSLPDENMVQRQTPNIISSSSDSVLVGSTTPYATSDTFDTLSLDPSTLATPVYTIAANTPPGSFTSIPNKFNTGNYSKTNSSVDTIPPRTCPLPTSEHEKREAFKKCLTAILSCTYAILLLMLGLVLYILDIYKPNSIYAEVFNIYLTLAGLLWIIFLHFDIRRFVNNTKNVKNESSSRPASVQGDYQIEVDDGGAASCLPPQYCFRTGRHSGSFYLKIGAAAFCFGHLIHEGLLLSRQIIYWTSSDEFYRENCFSVLNTALDIVHPIFSFYQLFIIFKYSNVVINRFRELARFGLMHVIATNLCFWMHTIIREAIESMLQKLNYHNNSNESYIKWPQLLPIINNTEENLASQCVTKQVLSNFTVESNPYLFPFTIEYSLLLVGIWFIIWHNIGREETEQQKLDRRPSEENDNYTSNLVIHVDCHSANRGLFAGIFVLLVTVISVIIFFVAIMNDQYVHTGLLINNISDVVLLLLMTLTVIVAYRQTSILDINLHAVTFLDDTLLFVALPCFFSYGILNIIAGISSGNEYSIISAVLSVVQVTIQTPFIIDGLRRCSNSHELRYRKPGREIVTFLIVCNVAAWIMETFEIKSFEAQVDKFQFYGQFIWTLLSHFTLPLTLFYRFHSSVCLADIWKSAYEAGD